MRIVWHGGEVSEMQVALPVNGLAALPRGAEMEARVLELARAGVRDPVIAQTLAAVVNAAEAWAGKIAAMMGDDIPLGHKASMMMVMERVAPLLDPVVSVVGRPLSFK